MAIKRVAIIGELEDSDTTVACEACELQANLDNDDDLLDTVEAC